MAIRVLPFVVTIPAGTTAAAPATTPINLDGWTVQRIDLDVPPGPGGLMGFQIYNNGVPWIPYGNGQWIIWDDAKDSYYLEEQPTGGGWAVVGYNTGVFPHSVTVRFHVTSAVADITPTAAPALTFITTQVPETPVVTLG